MRRIVSACPGSCGEWLQGWMMGGEKLISYAIDSFSRVTLEEADQPTDGHLWLRQHRPRAWQMMQLVMEKAAIPLEEQKSFRLSLESPLPLAKGMASSTADLAAVGDAVTRWFGKELSAQELTTLCAQLEPTDSILFPSLSLMDPLTGEVSLTFEEAPPELELVVLEGKKGIVTETSRKAGHDEKRKAYATEMDKALNLFRKGLKEKEASFLAEAAWISAQGNEVFYPQAGLEVIREVALRCGAMGINVAHSGSTIGVLYRSKEMDREKFQHHWQGLACSSEYQTPRHQQMIAGGIRREE